MARFLIRRILQGILVMWLVTVSVFLIFYIGPGPSAVARTLAGKSATPQVVAAVSHRLLLDRPFYVQYGHFLWLLLHGNLGYSFYHSQSVNSIIARRSRSRCRSSSGAAILWIVMGVLSGVLSAVRARSVMDRTFTGLALLFYSMPTFVLGLLLLLVFYYEFTIHGIHVSRVGLHVDHGQPMELVRGLVLPWITLVARVGRDLHPADPRLDAGRHGRGLHQDRAGQGHAGATGDLPARPAGRADAGRDPVRHRRRRLLGGVVITEPCSACRASATPRCSRSSSRTCPWSSAW